MIFIESAVFTKQVRELLSDESYAEFQQYLAQCPEAGDVIRDTGGLRKYAGRRQVEARAVACGLFTTTFAHRVSVVCCSSIAKASRTT